MAATVAPAHRAEARRQTSQRPCRLKKKHFEGVAFHHKKKVASEAAEAGGQSLFWHIWRWITPTLLAEIILVLALWLLYLVLLTKFVPTNVAMANENNFFESSVKLVCTVQYSTVQYVQYCTMFKTFVPFVEIFNLFFYGSHVFQYACYEVVEVILCFVNQTPCPEFSVLIRSTNGQAQPLTISLQSFGFPIFVCFWSRNLRL